MISHPFLIKRRSWPKSRICTDLSIESKLDFLIQLPAEDLVLEVGGDADEVAAAEAHVGGAAEDLLTVAAVDGDIRRVDDMRHHLLLLRLQLVIIPLAILSVQDGVITTRASIVRNTWIHMTFYNKLYPLY